MRASVPRTILVHYHLFKNAGSTVDGILRSNLPEHALGSIEGAYPWPTVSPDELLAYAASNSALRAISSHQARLPVPNDPHIAVQPLLFLRHPVDRIASVYEFERRQPADSLSPSAGIARHNDLAAFVEWAIGRSGTAVCRNCQVIHLAGCQSDMRIARATHLDYRNALANLRALPAFGIVEQFEISLRLFERCFKRQSGTFHMQYTIENASPGRATTVEQRLSNIEEQLGASLYRELLELNALDMLLYEEALDLFAVNCIEYGLIESTGVVTAISRDPQAALNRAVGDKSPLADKC